MEEKDHFVTVRKYLKQIEDVVRTAARVGSLVRVHWKASLGIATAAIIYWSAWFWAYSGPTRFLDAYFECIVGRDLNQAWASIHPSYQAARWRNDFATFQEGYGTTYSTAVLEIDPTSGRSFSPIEIARHLVATVRQYDVLNEVRDRFTQSDCLLAEHHSDCLWAEVSDEQAFRALMDGTMKGTLELKRTFKKRYTLRWTSPAPGWRIANVELLETRLPVQKSRP